MPAISNRDDENAKRKQRLAKLKKGPGTFVYDGSAKDVHYVPTVLLVGKKVAVFDAEGMPVVDENGEQVYQRPNRPVIGTDGKPKLGGKPKIELKPLDVRTVRGVKFPAGKPVSVDAGLALKLRGMNGFEEVESDGADAEASSESDEPASGRARKRRRAAVKEADAEASSEE